MDEQLKALLEGINALKNSQEETTQEMQKSLEDMQKSQEETKNELKERMEKGQEETKKGQEDVKNSLEKKIDTEEKINSVEEKLTLKVEEKIAVVEEKIAVVDEKIAVVDEKIAVVDEKIAVVDEKIAVVDEKIAVVDEKIAVVDEKIKKVGEEIERIKEQVEERIEGVAENFSLISRRVEDLEKKLLVCGNNNESKILPSSPVPVSTSLVPVSPVSVKLPTYDGKTNWEVYKTQFLISEANGWTEGAKACQLAASLRGEAAEILQTLPNTERLNLNSLYNALDFRFGQKYSKDYARLQMKKRLQKTVESLQEYAFEEERLTNLAFSNQPATVREVISLQYFVNGLKEGEIQKAVRMADVQDLKSALLYALKLEAATQASRKNRHSIQGARVTADEPCESRLIKKMEKLKEEMKTIKAGILNQEKRNFKCWGCEERDT
ncbi:uncharacterized protein TNCV_822531 [Trichonephila clavipes]|nr:uncharacterized protein TNCV_822531 [Trichonephila clavipes]